MHDAPPTDRSTGEIDIRPATPESLRGILTQLALAFGEELSDPEFEDFSRFLELDRVVGAFEGEAPVASAGAIGFRLTVPGGAEVEAAGVTIVGVRPSHRRRGILRRLMRRVVDDARGRGEPVAVLWASEGAIYQRFGFGMATLNGTFEIERSRVAWLQPPPRRGTIRIVDRDEAVAAFPPVYEARRQGIPGALARSEDYWRWSLLHDAEYMRHGSGPKVRALLEIDGRVEAYAIYRSKPEWEDRGPKSQVLVLEVLGTSPAAEQELWAWLLDLDLVHAVRAWRQPVPHPLQLQLAEPRRLGLLAADGLWLRIIDLPLALEARRYRSPGSLVLGVSDEFCPWNDGAWRIGVDGGGGGATIVRSEDAPDIALGAADLAAAYLGAFSFRQLADAGRLVERSPAAIERADAMFATDRAPWCSTGF